MNKYFTRGLSLVFVIVFFFISDSLLPINLANAATTYTITFDANGGAGSMPPQMAERNKKVSLSPIGFSRSGYTFSGWSKNKNAKKGTIRDESEYKIGSRNVTLYAIWSEPAYHTIFFDSSNGASGTMEPQRVLEGVSVTLNSNAFTKPGYDFEYWDSPIELSNGVYKAFIDNDIFTMGSSDVTLTAMWKRKSNTIFFIPNTEDYGSVASISTMLPQTIPLGSTANLNPNTFKHFQNKTFLAWVSEDGSRYYEDEDPYTMILPEGERLFTVWSELSTTTVNFYPNDGKGKMPSVEFVLGKPSILPENTFEKKGYLFDYWKAWGEIKFDDGADFLTALAIQTNDPDLFDLKTSYGLFAVWSKESYTVTFNPNWPDPSKPGTGTTTSLPLTPKEKPSLPLNGFKQIGYDFQGWSTTLNGPVTYKDGAKFSLGKTPSDMALYAVWSETPHHFVRFNANGSLSDGVIGSMEDFPMYENSADYLPLNLGQITKTGHTFNGWSTKKTGPFMYGDGDPITMGKKDITLYAVWTANTYRAIFFDPNGGNGTMSSQTANIGADVTLPANTFTKSGEVFGGWTGSDGVYYPNNGSFKMGSTDITLSANWHSASYTYRVTNAEVPAVNGYYRWVGPGEEGTGLYSNAPVGQDYKYYTCLGWNPGLGWWGFSACYNWLWYIHTEERDSLDGPWIRGTGPSTIKVERASPGAIAPDTYSYATALYSWESVLKLIRALLAD